MRFHLSPFRYALEIVLNLVGHGPRRSCFTPARDPESRVRFAQYLSRVQPTPEQIAARQAARMLGSGGTLSRGIVRHAPLTSAPETSPRRATFNLFSQHGDVAGRRRVRSTENTNPLRTLLDALRVR
jgi:hypothetical protein